jgi:hypothetical protein
MDCCVCVIKLVVYLHLRSYANSVNGYELDT